MPAPKRSLSATFPVGGQPVLDPEPTPKAQPQPTETPKATPKVRDHRANRQAFTVWLDRDLVTRLRAFSRDLVVEEGRAGNSIESLVTEGIEHVLANRRTT